MDEIKSALLPAKRNSETMQAFGFRLNNQFSINKSYRRAKELEWLESLRQYKGLYDSTVKIDANNSKVYPKITRSKVNIVLSRLHEMLFPEQDSNWEISPTPEPSISKEVVKQIALSLVQDNPETGEKIIPTADDLKLAIDKFTKEACVKMSSTIDDQLTEMDYSEETKKVLRSGLMYGTGIMKGPMVGKRTKRTWQPTSDGRDYEEKVAAEEVPDLRFVRIWDWYPDMSTTELDSIEGSFERHVMTKHDLRQLIKRPDFFGDIITSYLSIHPDGNYVPLIWETELQVIEVEAGADGNTSTFTTSTSTYSSDNRSTSRQLGKKYEVLEYWGYVDGSDLAACGLDITDPTIEYAANVWIIGGKIIKCVLYEDALKQYKVFYYEKDETSIFGEGLARIMRHSQIAIAAAARMTLDNAACLTGDTQVYRNQSVLHETENNKRPAIITLRDLWNKKGQYKNGLRRNKVRCVNEDTGEIFFNRIVDIFHNGLQPVYLITTEHGYNIKATLDHKFMCDDGEWKEVSGFAIGDLIAVNGQSTRKPGVCIDCGKPTKGAGLRCRSCASTICHPPNNPLPKNCIECGAPTSLRGVRCRNCASKLENNTWNRHQIENSIDNIEVLPPTSRQRWVCQKDKKDFCQRCGMSQDSGVRLCVHHNDRNPYNNDPSNKLTLCQPCHMFIHNRFDYFGQPFQHRYVDYDEIVSMEYIGIEEVFDLQMESPYHNFIANGFVAHNCVAGPQLEVNVSVMAPNADYNSIYPRKIWFREGRGIDAQYPAVRVYNIDSHIDELLKIIETFKQFGDEETTLPTWMIGQSANNETAQATSGRMATITISIKDVVRNFDAFTERIIRDLYRWNMEFNPRTDIKGDYTCKAKGVSSLVMKEIRMQALTQLTTTLTPEEWEYMPKREFLQEKLKAHDIKLDLLSDEEVAKKQQAAEQSTQNQLALEMAQAEIKYKNAQTMAQLTKAKEHNVKATKDAATPPETPPGQNPELQTAEVESANADIASKQTDITAKNEEIRRQEEQHQLNLRHQEEKHRSDIITSAHTTQQDMEMKAKQAEHGMKMKERVVSQSNQQQKQQKATNPPTKTTRKPKGGMNK
jgi:hypothetical protein